jgi:hypothetical protein
MLTANNAATIQNSGPRKMRRNDRGAPFLFVPPLFALPTFLKFGSLKPLFFFATD